MKGVLFMRTEKGILFPKRLDSSSTEVLEKTYSFDDVVTISHNIPDDSLFPNKKKMVSHNEPKINHLIPSLS